MHRIHARLVATIVAATLIAACDRPSVSPSAVPTSAAHVDASPTTSPVPTRLATSPPTPVPTRLATSSPTPAPSAPPATLGPWSPTWTIQPVAPRFDVVWIEVGSDIPAVGSELKYAGQASSSWAELHGTYAFTADQSGAGPRIWRSTDLLDWRPAIPQVDWLKRVHARQLVRGGPGLIAVGTDQLDGVGTPRKPALWLSSDGGSWQRAPDDAVPAVEWLYGYSGGLIGFGMDTWTSTDGLDWRLVGPSPLRALDASGYYASTVLDVGGSALVFFDNYEGRPVQVHRLHPSGQWQKLSEIPDSVGVVEAAVLGPQGLVVIGAATDTLHAIWRSVDAVEWQRATRPPQIGWLASAKLAAIATGYVVVSARIYFEGCVGEVGGSQIPETWASVDGLRWRRVATPGTRDHQELSALIGGGDALIAAGYTWPGSGWEGAMPTLWRAEVRILTDGPAATLPAEGSGCQ